MPETFAEYTARLLALAEGAQPLEVLAATAARIGRAIAARGAADLQWSPDPGRWSLAQIVAHLADAEIVFAYRMRMILSTPGTAIQAYDQDRWSTAQQAAASDAFESLSLFTAARTANLRLLRRLSAEERARYGIHAERGHESIEHLMRLYAGHDRNHLAQIEQLLAQRTPAAEATGGFRPAPAKLLVDPAVLEQLDVRVGTIRAVAPVANADRLALLTVSFADRDRTIVAGLRTERPSLDAIVGRQALFVVNFHPKKIRGHVSEGMLFDVICPPKKTGAHVWEGMLSGGGFAAGWRPAFAMPEWPAPGGVRAG